MEQWEDHFLFPVAVRDLTTQDVEDVCHCSSQQTWATGGDVTKTNVREAISSCEGGGGRRGCVTMGPTRGGGGVSQRDHEGRGGVTTGQRRQERCVTDQCLHGRTDTTHPNGHAQLSSNTVHVHTIGISAELAQFRRKCTKERPVMISVALVHKSMHQYHLLLLRRGRA